MPFFLFFVGIVFALAGAANLVLGASSIAVTLQFGFGVVIFALGEIVERMGPRK